MEVVRNTPPIRTIYLLSLLLCVAIVAAYYVGCRHRREVFLDLYIDGVSVDAVLKNAGVGEDGSLEIVVAVPHPSDTITRLKRKGVAVKKLVKQIPEVTKTSYPLTMDTPYVINNPNICTNISNLKFLVIVHSATQNFQRRRLIRETWANKNLFKDLSVRILFLFGITHNEKVQSLIENESLVYEDIVQARDDSSMRHKMHPSLTGVSLGLVTEHRVDINPLTSRYHNTISVSVPLMTYTTCGADTVFVKNSTILEGFMEPSQVILYYISRIC